MSMFKSLQNAPRVISLFTKIPQNSNLLNAIQAKSSPHAKYELEIHTKFPTKEQLGILSTCKPSAIYKQAIPFLKDGATQLPKETIASLANEDLKDIRDSKIWFKNSEFWVDWEHLKIGDSVETFPDE